MWKSKTVRCVAGCAASLVVFTVFLCWRVGIHSTRDAGAYIAMTVECNPVWNDVAIGQIREGQPVEYVILSTKPIYVARYGRFVELRYQGALAVSGVHIVAVDGKLAQACAAGCTWNYTFFDSMTKRDRKEMSLSYDTAERRVTFEGQLVTRPEEVNDAATEPL